MENNFNTRKTIELSGRKITLLGTAHVSRESVLEVEKTIEELRPESVAIELDDNRLQNLKDPDSWKKMDIVKILRKKMGFLMLANIVLASYQKRMGSLQKVKPGEEMLAAVNKCQELSIPTTMADRPVAVTLRRAWAKNSLFGKFRLLTILVLSAFSKEEVTPDEIENLKKKSEMDTMMNSLSDYLPVIKEVLIDERDYYLASKIWESKGNTVLAVLGAGHMAGVEKQLELIASGKDDGSRIEEISKVPPKSFGAKLATWIIPGLIMALIGAGFYFGGVEEGTDLIGNWILWNAALAAVGAIIAGGHVLTVISSALGAPITSLCPLIGIGVVSGLVQAVVKKPSVSDMETLQEDAGSIKGFYRNRILRVFLVFFLSSVGSSIGTFVSGSRFVSIFAKLFSIF